MLETKKVFSFLTDFKKDEVLNLSILNVAFFFNIIKVSAVFEEENNVGILICYGSDFIDIR